MMKAQLLSGLLDDQIHIVACTENGTFAPQQCDPNHKICWCVNDQGEKISGTTKPYEREEIQLSCCKCILK